MSRTETTVPQLLAAVGYDFFDEADRESCNWLNVVVGHYLSTCRASDTFRTVCLNVVNSAVNGPRRPSFLVRAHGMLPSVRRSCRTDALRSR